MNFLALFTLICPIYTEAIKFRVQNPPTELEYGFCEGSPEPLTLDIVSVEPFPMLLHEGATITLEFQITLKEEIPSGTWAHLNLTMEGVVPMEVPCLDTHHDFPIGSCDYDLDALFLAGSDFLCPSYVPEGQECSLPLGPGVYGGGDPLVLGPIESIPDILLPFLKGTVRAEATVTDASGATVACVYVRAAVDH